MLHDVAPIAHTRAGCHPSFRDLLLAGYPGRVMDTFTLGISTVGYTALPGPTAFGQPRLPDDRLRIITAQDDATIYGNAFCKSQKLCVFEIEDSYRYRCSKWPTMAFCWRWSPKRRSKWRHFTDLL